MDSYARAYLGALRRATGVATTNGLAAKRAAPDPILGDLGWGQSLASGVANGAASHGVGQALSGAGKMLGNVGGGLYNLAKLQGRDMTYGPVVDGFHHGQDAANFALQGDVPNALRSAGNAGIDTVSAGLNAAFALGAPVTGGADEAVGQPLKQGLVYGLRHLVGGAAAPLWGGAVRPGVTAGVRSLAQPVLGAAERLGAGGLADTARSVGSAASGWLERSAGTAGSQLLSGQIPTQWSGIRRVVPTWLSSVAAPVLHWRALNYISRLQSGLDDGIQRSQFRQQLHAMTPEQLHQTILDHGVAEAEVPGLIDSWRRQGMY